MAMIFAILTKNYLFFALLFMQLRGFDCPGVTGGRNSHGPIYNHPVAMPDIIQFIRRRKARLLF